MLRLAKPTGTGMTADRSKRPGKTLAPALILGGVLTLSLAQAMETSSGGEASVKGYCDSLAVSLGDAEKAAQIAMLTELEAKLKQRVAELAERQTELRAWLKQRDEAMARADAALVDIYAKMKPEAAAAQLATMEDTMAAALLGKLSTRAASAILNEIAPARAAKLAEAMGLAGGKSSQKKI
jgi:flagellar motility protein MotE (MotC chaperone)